MATIDLEAINANFAFADNPIVVKATDFDFPEGSIFRQVIFEVDTYYNKLDSEKRTYAFTVNVDDGASSVQCDVSSALRSTFAKYQYVADGIAHDTTIVYPTVSYRVSVYSKWMIDGIVDQSAPTAKNETLLAYMGGLSDYERWKERGDINSAVPTTFSTKPSGEVLDKNQPIAITTFDSANGEVVTAFSMPRGGLIDARNRATILYVNSRGVFDTVSVIGYDSEEYEITSDVRGLVGSTAYRPSPYLSTHKEGGGAVWKMTSGYVNKDWAQWYAREFLMAKHYWLLKDSCWLPVAIAPDGDSVVTYDRNDPSLLSVNFTVRSAIKG